jgi:hypothetical protein
MDARAACWTAALEMASGSGGGGVLAGMVLRVWLGVSATVVVGVEEGLVWAGGVETG